MLRDCRRKSVADGRTNELGNNLPPEWTPPAGMAILTKVNLTTSDLGA